MPLRVVGGGTSRVHSSLYHLSVVGFNAVILQKRRENPAGSVSMRSKRAQAAFLKGPFAWFLLVSAFCIDALLHP